ncbi:hypothetical protein AURDEDRAFT_169507 [Auricularia subglabra TFB-10046 SS5]|uniref:F-box domain-containing protein n=1 Tax=Auricularia subglabra (strain TFB-10046 / SS5) TaxID=717982 RepID=J0DD88_AURST|nr:hypothetical protein AURDEDRAFT_169507 [Auricularia subglabra TFB-10046 SS5]
MEREIPLPLRLELFSCVRRIAEHFLDSPSDQLRGLVNLLSSDVARVVTAVITERNCNLAGDAAMPSEVWCAIWQHLPFASRITVSHVCTSWRKTALACPLLWNDIKVTFWRREACYVGNAIGPDLATLGILLGRAAPAPTRLNIRIEKFDWHPRAGAFFHELLCTHALQIVYLRFSARGQAGGAAPMRDVLPLMHGLQHLRLSTTDFDLRIESFIRPGSRFACLRVLELDGIFFEEAASPDMFPHVEEVLIIVTQCPLTPVAVENMFRSCPKTTKLTAYLLAGWWNDHPPDALGLHTMTPCVASLRLHTLKLGIFSPGELYISRVLHFFQHERIPCLSVIFGYNSSHDALSIFSDLEKPDTLVFRARAGAKAIDSRGFSRQVLWDYGMPKEEAETLLARFAPSLTTLIADAQLFIRFSSPLSTPRLKSIVLRLLDASELPATTHPKVFQDLPAFRTLCLQLVDSCGLPRIANGRHRVDVAAVQALIEALPRRVEVLQLAQIKFKKQADRSPLELLRSRVGSVEAVSCDAEEHRLVVDVGGQMEQWGA